LFESIPKLTSILGLTVLEDVVDHFLSHCGVVDGTWILGTNPAGDCTKDGRVVVRGGGQLVHKLLDTLE